jgi:hypothetical protein
MEYDRTILSRRTVKFEDDVTPLVVCRIPARAQHDAHRMVGRNVGRRRDAIGSDGRSKKRHEIRPATTDQNLALRIPKTNVVFEYLRFALHDHQPDKQDSTKRTALENHSAQRRFDDGCTDRTLESRIDNGRR